MSTMVHRFLDQARRRPGVEAFRVLRAGGAAADDPWTWARWEEQARRVAAALIGDGGRPGDRVAILAGNRPVWPVAEVGVLMAGMVSVGVHPTGSPVQVAQAIRDADPVAVLADTGEQLAKLAATPDLRRIRTVVTESPPSGAALAWDDWLGDPAATAAEVARRIETLEPGAPAIIIYTSGSTGVAKGAVLSHGTVRASAEVIAGTLGFGEADTALSFLPFSHAAERIFGLHTRIVAGMHAGLVPDHARWREAALDYRPTIFGGLPRLYERAAETLAAEGGRAVDYFGGRVRIATSGGATFPAAAVRLLAERGLEVLGAYGLTEHLCVAMQRPGEADLETAGPPLPGSEVAIAPDGEILVRRSILTFAGYFRRPVETGEAFTPDGTWLRTGDLGAVDDRGRLRVTGRKKDLVALSSGRKVAPAPIETRLAADPLIAGAFLYGDGRPHLTAALWVRRPAVEAWGRTRGIEGPWPALLGDPAVAARLQEVIDGVNRDLGHPERIRGFVVVEGEPTVAGGELTPTLKLRREALADRYRARLDALYRRTS